MDISEKGLAFVAAREACVLTVYQDTRNPAIGFGVNDATLKPGQTISFEEAQARYVTAAAGYSKSIDKIFEDVNLQQQHKDAIFSTTWNIGATRMRQEVRFGTALREFYKNLTDRTLRDRAAYELLHVRWDLNGWKPFNLSRRCLEAVLFIKGEYHDIDQLSLWREGKVPGRDMPEMVPMPTFLKGAFQ